MPRHTSPKVSSTRRTTKAKGKYTRLRGSTDLRTITPDFWRAACILSATGFDEVQIAFMLWVSYDTLKKRFQRAPDAHGEYRFQIPERVGLGDDRDSGDEENESEVVCCTTESSTTHDDTNKTINIPDDRNEALDASVEFDGDLLCDEGSSNEHEREPIFESGSHPVPPTDPVSLTHLAHVGHREPRTYSVAAEDINDPRDLFIANFEEMWLSTLSG